MPKIGPLEPIISTIFPSIVNANTSLPDGDSWVLLDQQPVICPRCDGRAIRVFRLENYNPMTGILLYCATQSTAYLGLDLGIGFLGSSDADVKNFLSTADVASFSKIELITTSSRLSTEATSKPTTVIQTEMFATSAPVPAGYKNIAWIKEYEAQAIVMAYERQKSIPVVGKSRKQYFEAIWHRGTEEAKKFHADVQANRFRSGNFHKTLGWIRKEEAESILLALREEKSLEFEHVNFGKGGIVEYFHPASQVALTYKSRTRLLRKL